MSQEKTPKAAHIYIQPEERQVYDQLMRRFGFSLSATIRFITRDWCSKTQEFRLIDTPAAYQVGDPT